MNRLIALMMLASSAVQAGDGPVSITGFGTLGIAHSSDKGADCRSNIEQITGTGRSNT